MKTLRERWLIGMPLMIGAFCVSALAAGPPLVLWQYFQMDAGLSRDIAWAASAVWQVIVFIVGPPLCYKVVRTVLDREEGCT